MSTCLPQRSLTLAADGYQLYLVGEAVPQHVNDSWAPGRQLFNMYGPTEGTCGATIKRLHYGEPVSIGKPNLTTRLYILDRHQRLLPPGSPGEIFIAGVQVARGYVGRPEITSERFLTDSISCRPGENMYRTGDLGYWTSTGEVHLIGRNDRLVKLRGFRVDLDDLEVLARQAVGEALTVVIVRKGDDIAALIQPSSVSITSARLRIANYLPHFAIPKYITAIDDIPLTSIGKIDYQAVTELFGTQDVYTSVGVSIQSTDEKLLERVWRELLRLDGDVNISADMSLLALGGDSLSQILLASRLTAVFNRKISTKMVVEARTLRDLAHAIGNIEKSDPGDASISKIGESGVSPVEQDWWLLYGTEGDHSPFNVCLAYDLDSTAMDIGSLECAWNIVLDRHKILSSRYVLQGEHELTRLHFEHGPCVLRVANFDLSMECNQIFRLDEGRLFRVLLSKSQMLVCASHIICDLTTMRVLAEEVAAVYKGGQLSPVERSYEDITCWHKPVPLSSASFWMEYLAGRPSPRQHRAEKLRKPRTSFSGRSRTIRLPATIYKRLQGFVIRRSMTFHQIMLAAVSVALHANGLSSPAAEPKDSQHASSDHSSLNLDIILGSPYLNRESDDLSVVGLMLEPLPVRIRFPIPPSATLEPNFDHKARENETSISAFLRSVRLSSQSALAHALPSSQILNLLSLSRSDSSDSTSVLEHPLFDVMVTFHDERHAPPVFSLPGLQPRLVWAEGSKFGLMAEFTAVDEEVLLLRVEFDEAAYAGKTVERVVGLVCAVMEALVEGEEGEAERGFEAMVEDLCKRAGSMR